MTPVQWLHILSLILGGAVVVAGIYNDMSAATAIGVFVVVVNAIGTYLGGPATTAPTPLPEPPG